MDNAQTLNTPEALRFKYKYLRLLGEGSNGKTYLAQDLDSSQHVAIKAFKPKSNEVFKNLELFKREAMTLSSITVKGVPKFYQSVFSNDLTEDNYIIQEYIDAPSLQSYLDDHVKFSEADTLILMDKIAHILLDLHTRYTPPIIHRDIKPSNILCKCPQNQSWKNARLYLIDFGAVANACATSDKSTIAGTIGYMAPEQNFGECLPQSDYYALGATALHLLTGVPPYEMEFEYYTPNIDKVLKENAPETTKYMRELLAILLNKAADKRPKDAQMLLRMIHNARTHILPLDSEPKPENSSNIFNRAYVWLYNKFAQIMQSKTADGYIQSCTNNDVYYTFDINNQTWQGIEDLNSILSKQNIRIRPGMKCIVSYNARDPGNNSLDLIIPSNAPLIIRKNEAG